MREMREQLRSMGLPENGNTIELMQNKFVAGKHAQNLKRKLQATDGSRKRSKPSFCPNNIHLKRTFETYSNGGEEINYEGMLKLCEDLQVTPEDPIMIVLAWFCKADQLGIFTKDEFSPTVNSN